MRTAEGEAGSREVQEDRLAVAKAPGSISEAVVQQPV